MKFRTRYLIHPKFQLAFSGLLVLIALISAVLVGIVIYQLIYANTLLFVKYNLHTDPDFLALLAKERKVILVAWIGSFLSVAILLFIAGIFLSHKMAGPLYAFKRELQKLQNGDFTAYLELRKKDEFKELKIPFNQWVESLQKMTEQDIEKLSPLIKDVASILSQMMQQKAEEKDIGEMRELLNHLNEMVRQKEKQLSGKLL